MMAPMEAHAAIFEPNLVRRPLHPMLPDYTIVPWQKQKLGGKVNPWNQKREGHWSPWPSWWASPIPDQPSESLEQWWATSLSCKHLRCIDDSTCQAQCSWHDQLFAWRMLVILGWWPASLASALGFTRSAWQNQDQQRRRSYQWLTKPRQCL